MTRDDVAELFKPLLIGDAIRISRYVQVAVDDFADLFSEAEPTYESLCSVDETKGLGYTPFFARCKDGGLFD